MKPAKIIKGLIITFTILAPFRVYAQPNQRVYADTLHGIVTDSFSHDLGDIPMVNNKLVKYFNYTGPDTLFILRTWTGDPHYICDHPKGPIVKGKDYSITVCFWNEGRTGLFHQTMGFELSNGKSIVFVFKGRVLKKE